MKEITPVKSSIKKEIEFIFEWGILIGIILSILDAFPFLRLYRYLYLHTAAKWPCGILTGIILAAIIMLLRRTTVLVKKDSVVIKRMGRSLQLSIDDFDVPVIKRKEHHIWVIKKIATKIYLSFSYINGTKVYRLFEFSEMGLEQVLQFIREQRSENMSVEEKLAVWNSLNNIQDVTSNCENMHETGERSVSVDNPPYMFSLWPEEIRQHERKTILKIGGIWLIILAALLILILGGISQSSGENFKMIFCVFLLCLLLAAVPVQLLQLSWKLKHCPESIRIGGNAMWVGEKYFSYTGVSYISMTSPRKKSDSIFPVQYWMTIRENGEKNTYWLGSQASYGEYRELCKILEQALLMRPNKLKYGGKFRTPI